MNKKIAIIRPGFHTINDQFCFFLGKESDYKVHLFVPSFSIEDIKPSGNYELKSYHSLFKKYVFPIGLFFKLVRGNYDLVQSGEDYLLTSFISLLYCMFFSKKFVLINEKYKPPSKKIIRLLYSFVDLTIGNFVRFFSDKIIYHSKASYFFSTQKLISKTGPIIPIGVDWKSFCQASSLDQNERIDIISVGRLINHKNFPLLFDAIDSLRKEGYDVVLSVFGDGPERKKLEKMISDLGLEKNIFLMGKSSYSDIKREYCKHNLFVLSSKTEVLGAVILEAMASGLPVVVPNIGGCIDFVDGNGEIFQSENLYDLKEKIKRAFCNRDKYSKRSLCLVKTRFDWNNVIKDYINVFEDLNIY